MSWWRRNRWALLGLPPALAAALVASSDRVGTYYWDVGLHDATRAPAGVWLEHRALIFSDASGEAGELPIEVGLRLDGLTGTTQGWEADSLVLPAGARAIQVDLSLRAGPDVPLRTCSLALRDADGTRYDYTWDAAGAYQPSSPCVPPLTPGPWAAFGGDTAVDDPRPAEWSVAPVVVVPEDADIVEVLVWWEMPAYVALSVD